MIALTSRFNEGLRLAVNTKKIAIKFENVSEHDGGCLHAFMSRELLAKKFALDQVDDKSSNMRSIFRVVNRGAIGKLKVVTAATASIPQQELDVEIENISVGGCLIVLPDAVALSKGGTIYFNFEFLQPPISVQGIILGRRGK